MTPSKAKTTALLSSLALCALHLLHGSPEDSPVVRSAEDFNYTGEFLKMLFALGGLIALVIVALLTTKRLLQKRVHRANQTNLIKVLEKRTLSAKSQVYAIGVLDRLLIVGESPSGLQTLGEFPAGTHLEALYNMQKKERE